MMNWQNIKCTIKRIPLYIVQARGYRAWYVELWPFKFQSHDPMPDDSTSLMVHMIMGKQVDNYFLIIPFNNDEDLTLRTWGDLTIFMISAHEAKRGIQSKIGYNDSRMVNSMKHYLEGTCWGFHIRLGDLTILQFSNDTMVKCRGIRCQ